MSAEYLPACDVRWYVCAMFAAWTAVTHGDCLDGERRSLRRCESFWRTTPTFVAVAPTRHTRTPTRSWFMSFRHGKFIENMCD